MNRIAPGGEGYYGRALLLAKLLARGDLHFDWLKLSEFQRTPEDQVCHNSFFYNESDRLVVLY